MIEGVLNSERDGFSNLYASTLLIYYFIRAGATRRQDKREEDANVLRTELHEGR